MPIFTAAATFLLAGTALAGTFAVPLLATGFSLATSLGLSYAAKALAGNPNQEAQLTKLNARAPAMAAAVISPTE